MNDHRYMESKPRPTAMANTYFFSLILVPTVDIYTTSSELIVHGITSNTAEIMRRFSVMVKYLNMKNKKNDNKPTISDLIKTSAIRYLRCCLRTASAEIAIVVKKPRNIPNTGV